MKLTASLQKVRILYQRFVISGVIQKSECAKEAP